MLLASFAEIISIGAVLPFLGVLTSPRRVFEHPSAQPFIQLLGLTEAKELLLPLSIAFGLAALIAGAMRLLLLWAGTRLSYAAGADLSISVYRRTLYQPYAVHVTRNSSEIINGILSKTAGIIGVILMIFTLISSSAMLIAILIAMLSVDPVIALTAFGGFGLIYAFIIRLTSNKLLTNGQSIGRESTQLIKSLQEGLGGIRDVLIDGSQATYCQIYQSADQPLRRAQGSNIFIGGSPRYGMEALGMLLIAALAYLLAQQEEGITKAIPVLGALALGAQRLLPILQQAYSAWSPYAVSHAAIDMSLKAFHLNYGFPVVFGRFANFYGEHQQLYRIVPKTILSVRSNIKLPLHGGGKSVRAFIHATEVADGIERMIESGKSGEIHHFSPTRYHTVYEVVQTICNRLGADIEQATAVTADRPGKDMAYLMDASKAARELGWAPRVAFEDGIDRTIAWIDRNYEKMRSLPWHYVHKP